jgi:hypothetical protein
MSTPLLVVGVIVADAKDEENGDATSELRETENVKVEGTIHIPSD